MVNEKTVEFIDLYSHLESVIRDEYSVPTHVGAVSWLVQNVSGFRRYKDELNYCREVRNLLQHNERVNGDYAVVPSEAMLDSLRSVASKIERIPRARDLGTKRQDVYSVRFDDFVLSALKDIRNNAYTYVPVLQDSRVVGVFGEKTLLSYLFDKGTIGFSDDDTFNVFGDLLRLDNHGSDVFEFVPNDMLAFDIAELFYDYLKKAKRLGMVFVTEHGRSDERLLGVITAWDMVKYF